jgi:hypothetical protein
MQYNIHIHHKPSILNKADALSRRPDFPKPADTMLETAFPDNMFIYETSLDPLISAISHAQDTDSDTLSRLADPHTLTHNGHLWLHDTAIVVPEDNELQQGVISLFHDSTTAGHPGIL